MPEVVTLAADTVSLDVRWDAGSLSALADRMRLVAAPIIRGRIPSREHVVFANQPVTPDGSISLGDTNDVVRIGLSALDPQVEAVSLMVFMQPRANAARAGLDSLQRLTLTWRDDASGTQIAHVDDLLDGVRAVPAAEICRLNRSGAGWEASHKLDGFDAGLAGALSVFGVKL